MGTAHQQTSWWAMPTLRLHSYARAIDRHAAACYNASAFCNMFEERGAAGGTCPDLSGARADLRIQRFRSRFLIKSIPQRRWTGDRKGAGFQISVRADVTIDRSA